LLMLSMVNLISSFRLSNGGVALSADIHTSLQPGIGQRIDLCAGSRKIPATYLGPVTGSSQSLIIADDVQQNLLLPVPLTLNLLVEKEPYLWRLGPLIGIFANRFNSPDKPFGEQSSFICKLRTAASRMNAFCYVFSPVDIDWKNRTISGTIPPLPEDISARWHTVTLPFPDVIYDRGLFPKGEKRKAATEVRKVLRKDPDLKFFNPAFFGKWKTHQLLSGHEILYNHLPETRLYTSINDVRELLSRHATVYLKPSSGSSGKGIIRLASSPNGFVLSCRISKMVKTVEILTQGQLEACLNKLTQGRRYIVQQGLNLAKFKGNPFDIRILMQRNRHGQWRRTGMAARVAGSGNFISNIHAGGHAANISAVIPVAFPEQVRAWNILNDIRRLSSLVAAWVITESSSLFGEIAVDLGVDQSGKVWIIELNAIPGRSVFRHIKAMDLLQNAITRPMEFAFFLSGFSPCSEQK